MAVVRKFKKLARDPERFFVDAYENKQKHKRVGSLETTALDNDASNEKAKDKSPRLKFATDYSVIKNISYLSPNFDWAAYKRWNQERECSSSVYLPSGDLLLDIMLAEVIEEKTGDEVWFLPVWEQFSELAMADIDFRLRKGKPELVKSVVRLIGSVLGGEKKIYVVRANSTLFDLVKIMACEGRSEFSVLEIRDANYDIVDSEKCESRNLVYISENIHFRGSDESQIKGASDVVKTALEGMYPGDDLVLIMPNRKNGFLDAEAQSSLSKKYNKRVIFSYSLEESRQAMLDIPLSPSVKNQERLVWGYYSRNISAEVVWDAIELSSIRPSGIYERIKRRCVSTIAVPDPISNEKITNGRQKFLLQLLGSGQRVYGAGHLSEQILAEMYVQWGAEPSENKSRPEAFRLLLNRPKVFLEDGFVRSVGLWTDVNEPTCSVVIDDLGVYYDATRRTRLEDILDSDFVLNETERERARKAIKSIVELKVSKYNYAPVFRLDLPQCDRKKILVVDQKKGDMSIKYGLSSEANFWEMLDTAVDSGADVYVKQHPCAISGNPEEAHFTVESLKRDVRYNDVSLIGFEINPYSLIDEFDEVFVVTSGMGFEALLAGKKVTCFGAAFYSGWGITEDKVKVARRNRYRSIDEIFYVFYFVLSLYVNPKSGVRCELEELIDCIVRTRLQ